MKGIGGSAAAPKGVPARTDARVAPARRPFHGGPGPQGLYDPDREHDACGVGFIVNLKGNDGIETVAIVPPGVLGNADVHLVEAYAVHLAAFRKLRERMPAAQMGRFYQMMRALGLDPGGRAALVAEQPKENPYAGHPRAV